MDELLGDAAGWMQRLHDVDVSRPVSRNSHRVNEPRQIPHRWRKPARSIRSWSRNPAPRRASPNRPPACSWKAARLRDTYGNLRKPAVAGHMEEMATRPRFSVGHLATLCPDYAGRPDPRGSWWIRQPDRRRGVQRPPSPCRTTPCGFQPDAMSRPPGNPRYSSNGGSSGVRSIPMSCRIAWPLLPKRYPPVSS